MKVGFYCDLHVGSPIEIKNIQDPRLAKIPVYSLGDNFDLANCKFEDVNVLRKARDLWHLYFKDGCWIYGNHDVADLDNEHILIKTETGTWVVVHGDFESRGKDWAVKYRSRQAGASGFKRKFMIPFIDFLGEAMDRKMSKKKLDRCLVTIHEKHPTAKGLILAHRHPEKMQRYFHKGKEIIVLPMGYTEVDL